MLELFIVSPARPRNILKLALALHNKKYWNVCDIFNSHWKASKFSLALQPEALVNTSGRVDFSSPACIWGLLIGVLNQCQQFSRYIKVAFDGILFPNPVWDIFGEVFYNCFRKVQIF